MHFACYIAMLIIQLPMGSAVQQMAMKCWCLQFQPEDQSFLIQSNVFANISTVLSNVEEVPETADKKVKPSQPSSEKVCGLYWASKILCVCVCVCACVRACVSTFCCFCRLRGCG